MNTLERAGLRLQVQESDLRIVLSMSADFQTRISPSDRFLLSYHFGFEGQQHSCDPHETLGAALAVYRPNADAAVIIGKPIDLSVFVLPGGKTKEQQPTKFDHGLRDTLASKGNRLFLQLCWEHDGVIVGTSAFDVFDLLQNSSSPEPAGQTEIPEPAEGGAFALTADDSLAGYARQCAAELGTIPTPDCAAATVVPITLTTGETTVTMATRSDNCDKPALLRMDIEGQCVPNSRINHVRGEAVNGSEPTDWVYFCRRYKDRDPGSNIFDDVNMIGHNPNSGATCFFNSWMGRESQVWVKGKPERSLIPNPSSKKALAFWVPPVALRMSQANIPDELRALAADNSQSIADILCVRCHDNDPWINSPFVRQAKKVPYEGGHMNGKYFAVFFADDPRFRERWSLHEMKSPKLDGCTSCHRIGSSQDSVSFMQYSFGEQSTHDAFLSPKWLGKKWMPLGKVRPEHRDAFDEILKCKADRYRADPSCGWTPLPR